MPYYLKFNSYIGNRGQFIIKLPPKLSQKYHYLIAFFALILFIKGIYIASIGSN